MYTFKTLQELAWAIGVGVAVAVGTELVTIDVDTFTDSASWIAAVIAGSARAIGGAILSTFRRPS